MTKKQWNLTFLSALLLSLISSCINCSFAADSLRIEIAPFNIRVHYPSTGVQFYRDGIIYLLDSKLTRESDGEYVPFGSISMFYSPLKGNNLDKQGSILNSYILAGKKNQLTFFLLENQDYQQLLM